MGAAVWVAARQVSRQGVRRVEGGVNGTADPLPGPQPSSQGIVLKLQPLQLWDPDIRW